MYAHLIPAFCLTLDMLMNKIKIRPQQFKYQIFFNIFYFAMTFFSQLNYTHPVYFNNLNWFGQSNFSYLVDEKNNYHIDQTINPVPCNFWMANKATAAELKQYTCHELIKSYWCDKKGEVNEHKLPPYSMWTNCFLFVTTVFVVSLAIFGLNYLIHKAKLFGVVGYDPKQLKYMKKEERVHQTQIYNANSGQNNVNIE